MPPLTIPHAYSNVRPAAVAYLGGIAAVWKRSGNSTKLWWSHAQLEGNFGFAWILRGLIDFNAETDQSPALLGIPGSSHLLCVWKSVGYSAALSFSVFNGSYWATPKSIPGSDTQFPPSLTLFNGAAYVAWNGTGAALYLARYDAGPSVFEFVSKHDDFQLATGPAIASGQFKSGLIGDGEEVLYAAFTVFGTHQVTIAAFDGAGWRSDFKLRNAFSRTDVAACRTADGVCIAWKAMEDEFPAAVVDGASSQTVWYAMVNNVLEHFPQIAPGIYSNFSPSVFWNVAGAGGESVIALWETVFPLHPVAVGVLKTYVEPSFDGPYRPGLYGTVPAAAPSIYSAIQPQSSEDHRDFQTGLFAINAQGEVWAYRESDGGPYGARKIAQGVDYPTSPLTAYGNPTTNSVWLASLCRRDGQLQVFTQDSNDEWSASQMAACLPPGANFILIGGNAYGVDGSGTLVCCNHISGSLAISQPGFAPPGAPIAIAIRTNVEWLVPAGGSGPLNIFLVGNDETLWAFQMNGNSFDGGTQLLGAPLLPGSHVACGFQTAIRWQFLSEVDTGQSQLDVFAIDQDGQMQSWWEAQGSGWTLRAMEPDGGDLVPGGPIVIGAQLYNWVDSVEAEPDQLDLMTVDTHGALRIWFVYQSRNWDTSDLALPGSYSPGTHMCTTAQDIDSNGAPHQLTMFAINPQGHIIVHWVYEAEAWRSEPIAGA